METVEVTFNGDTILDDAVASFEDAVKAYKKFSIVANTSETVVRYRLSKIENYCTIGTNAILRDAMKNI